MKGEQEGLPLLLQEPMEELSAQRQQNADLLQQNKRSMYKLAEYITEQSAGSRGKHTCQQQPRAEVTPCPV